MVVPNLTHSGWGFFILPSNLGERKSIGIATAKKECEKLCAFHEIDLSTYKGKQSKVKMARNLVDYEAGKTIFATALGITLASNTNQTKLFEL